jgi:NTE family protein
MADAAFLRPDVLVLAGGGIVGEAWMNGVLAGIEDGAGVDLRQVESFVGTSAGAIAAARLAAGRRPPRPDGPDGADGSGAAFAAAANGPEPPEVDDDGAAGGLRGVVRDAARLGWAASAPLTGAAVALGAPAGGLARAAVLSRAASHGRPLTELRRRVARWDARFDGRLRMCAVDRRTGRRVVFGAPGAPPAEVADAVCASCAIPWVFSPVRIGDRDYVDGGVWSVTNLDAARAGRGTHVLCLDPAAALGGTDRRTAGVRAAFRAASELEIQGLRRRGARVLHLAPDVGASAAMGTNLMAPAHTTGALAAGYRQGLALAR